jgi:ABC-type uncharacterized transport system fused permease/ATPase subunit
MNYREGQSVLIAGEAGVGKSRLVEGKLVEHWGVSDSLTMLTQLGAIPEPGAEG